MTSQADSYEVLKEFEMQRLQESFTELFRKWIQEAEKMLPVNLIVKHKEPDAYAFGYQDGYQRAILEMRGFLEDYEKQ